jgi:5-methylcytosine-specific restriction endonuclease McrA
VVAFMSNYRTENKGWQEYIKLRPAILKRDNHKCLKCGSPHRLNVHHVNRVDDNKPDNLQTLCYKCHCLAPTGSKYWEWLGKGEPGKSKANNYVEELAEKWFKENYPDKTSKD